MRKVNYFLIVLIIVLSALWNGFKLYSPDFSHVFQGSAIQFFPKLPNRLKVVSEKNVTN